ncbi:MAG: hypothetical protein MJH11_21875 [Lentisphaeria bacterium]|nr:hypothetical protein [Lentisphaeria bacterium]
MIEQVPMLAAFAFGVIATLHPCPFTTNIAAIGILSSWIDSEKQKKGILLFFIVSYLLTFMILGIVLSNSLSALSSESNISNSLQKFIRLFMGPFLIIAGMLQTDLLKLNKLNPLSKKWTEGTSVSPMRGAILGSILALSFCPATAAVFFALLLPLAIDQQQMILYPVLYAAGAAIPLIASVSLLSRGKKLLNNAQLQKISVSIGIVLIISGIYLSITRLFV